MARRVIEHKDFSGGDWGTNDAWNTPKNTFSAVNMLLYSTGELGVRPGIQDISPSNLHPTNQIGNVILPYQGTFYTYTQGNQVWVTSAHRNVTASGSGGTFAGTVSSTYGTSLGNAIYYNVPGMGVYRFVTGTLTLLNAVNGQGIALSGDRLVIGAGPGVAALRYNGTTAGVSDLTSWPAANLIPVSDTNERIAIMYNQRGSLAIMKTTNGIFMLTGQLGVNEALRKVADTFGPYETVGQDSTCMTENGLFWYFADTIHRVPAVFDGTKVRYFEDQLIPYNIAGSDNVSPIFVGDAEGAMFLNGSYAPSLPDSQVLLFHHGAWTRHVFANLKLDHAGSVFGQATIDPGVTLATNPVDLSRNTRTSPVQVMVTNGVAGTPKIYGWALDLDRPGYDYRNDPTFDNFNAEMPGDVSSAQVEGTVLFPETHLETGDEFQVREVVVDFRSWDTRGTLSNHFDLEVRCLRTYDNSSPTTSLTSAWDEDGALSSTSGTIKREVFSFGEQGYGNGYQLYFKDIRGIAIQRIQVVLNTTNLRGT